MQKTVGPLEDKRKAASLFKCEAFVTSKDVVVIYFLVYFE